MQSPCPNEADWRAFALGRLGDERLEALATHLLACDACTQLLAGLDGQADEFVQDLAGLADERGEVPDELVASARAASEGAALDPGSRLLRRLAEGRTRLAHFELTASLGSGSFGHVFRAWDTKLEREVALKIHRAGALADAAEEERFQREARSAAQLAHPGIVRLFETGLTAEGVPYLVCEFVAGETLEKRLTRGALGVAEAAELVARVADALAFAHAAGVIHRDVKPSNILLDEQGRPHLADFGLAKREREDTVTAAGDLLGTPAYMSPELARGDAHHVDAKSDVYSLGVVLYEALTGERPFHGNRRLLLLQVLEDEPLPPRRLDESIPRDLETICLTALQKAPAGRYADARALADDLRCFLAGEPVRARRLSFLVHAWRWARREPLAASLVSAGVLGSVLGFAHLSSLSRELVRSAALDSATQYADLLEVVNDLYSSEVVERVGGHGVEVTADYATKEGAIPLPATLLTGLLERIEDEGSGMRGRHFSDYPFRTRRDGGPRDVFEREALDTLTRGPDEPYVRFGHDAEGSPVLRYARARVMRPSCVACHNAHPDSTRRDWKEGDVRGVLEVVRSLERDEARIRAGLRGTSLFVGGGAALMLALGFLVHVGDSRRRAAWIRGSER